MNTEQDPWDAYIEKRDDAIERGPSGSLIHRLRELGALPEETQQ